MIFRIGRIVVDVVAVEIDVVLVDPAQPGKAVRIDGVDDDQGGVSWKFAPLAGEQRANLGARAAESLDAVGRRQGDQQTGGIGRADAHDIGGQFLAAVTLLGIDVIGGDETGFGGGVEESRARLAVGGGEEVGGLHGDLVSIGLAKARPSGGGRGSRARWRRQ